MRMIPLLTVDATATFDAIATAKHRKTRTHMRAARPEVIGAYDSYAQAAPEVAALAALDLTNDQKAAMRHAFTVETAPMQTLRGNLLERPVVFRCPFCGISESSTLDHYLPKEHYPEFSILPLNLIPSCAVCNTLKRDRVLVEGTNVRTFLHPCYDSIPNEDFLTVRARIQNEALILSYSLRRPASITQRTFRHLQAHFDVLNLADRYRRMALDHLGEYYPTLKRAYGEDENASRVAKQLIEAAEDAEEAAGLNFWRAKLYRVLAANAPFCDGGFRLTKLQYRPN